MASRHQRTNRCSIHRRGPRRSASGLVRTLVVASSTLAILLVCFSMYQYSQLRSTPTRPARLPPTPTELTTSASTTTPGVPVGQAMVGPGRNITVSIYPREGTRSQLELSVGDWVPRNGSDHEFLLSTPEIRMRTNDGNDVRVTAREGILEAQRKTGGALDPRRGELIGDVVIELDRRTREEKDALPEELRNQPTPADLVRVKADRLEFDMEYSKLVVPGRIEVESHDASLQAEDLEIRFNEVENRVESLRIARGGRLELTDSANQYAISVPGLDPQPQQTTSLPDWLRATIQARLDAASQPPTPAPSSPPVETPPPSATSDRPVFRTTKDEESARPPVRYHARFDNEVDARHLLSGATQSRLQADVLELVRDFSDRDKSRAKPPQTGGTSGATAADPPPPTERVVVEWKGRLSVETLGGGSPSTENTRSPVSATGSPARLSHPEGDATCHRLEYDPDQARVTLQGRDDAPVVVRSLDQGILTGRSATMQRRGNEMEIHVVGPGTLSGNMSASTAPATPAPAPTEPPPVIEFAKELTAFVRLTTRTTVDFMGNVSTREHRLLDRAVFHGQVKVRESDTVVEADTLNLSFASDRSTGQDRLLLDRLHGTGQVALSQGSDRMTCDELDVAFAADTDGRARPKTAIASGNVFATQGERILRAKDTLRVEFETLTPSTSTESDRKPGRLRSAPREVHAAGDVDIHDPVQLLDLQAEQFECSIARGAEIERALVVGGDRPATVRLDTLTVTGDRIQLAVSDQWAEVPGPGRMTLLSQKDLDGRKLAKPVPIVVTWTESMKYRGRENRAVFNGGVHATSESATTFDCDQLLVEFEDAAPRPDTTAPADWGILQPFVDRITGEPPASPLRMAGGGANKEPVYLLADGHAVAETSEFDAGSGNLSSRSRISGPRLSVSLRSDTSKMLIEGPGDLQIEDFRPVAESRDDGQPRGSDLFAVGGDSGPSKTLIEWRERMWYDFAIAQTRFEGRVSLKHFSGAELERLFEMRHESKLPPGRSTFLNCDVLTVEFLDRDARAKDVRDAAGRRLGRLSGDHLRQFQASGSVVLQDQVEGLSVMADSVTYERPRQLLAIAGSKTRKAQIITQKEGKLPNQVFTERLFYNLATGKLELVQTTVKGQ